ncbi:MAG: hypothetical protein Q9169_005095 [Polycauliona sp. 2 TL-2023]
MGAQNGLGRFQDDPTDRTHLLEEGAEVEEEVSPGAAKERDSERPTRARVIDGHRCEEMEEENTKAEIAQGFHQ